MSDRIVNGAMHAPTIGIAGPKPWLVAFFAVWRLPFSRDQRGASAVEFALVLPIFLLLFAGIADFGGALYVKFGLNSIVSAAANYALVSSGSVNSSSGASLANNLATIVSNAHGSNWADGTVVVNNGPTATITSGTVSAGGTASNADLCYCPVKALSGITWGSSASCSTPCGSGGIAGKFVTIIASKAYSPIFSSYGLVKNGTISSNTVVVETQ